MLNDMLRLNIRSQIPRINIRTTPSRLDIQSHPAELHRDYQAPLADVHVVPAKIDIDSYPSRHAYGYTNHTDFNRANGQQGLQDVQRGTSRRTSEAWAMIDGGGKRGSNVIAQSYKRQVEQWSSRRRYIAAEAIPDPEIRVTPSYVEGRVDPGHDQMSIQTSSTADIQYTPSKAETSLGQAGDIRMWTTVGQYDIYA